MKKTVMYSLKYSLIFFAIVFAGMVGFAADIIRDADMISPRGMCYDEANERIIVADSAANAIFEIDIKTLKVKRIAGISVGTDLYGMPVGGYVDGKLEKAMFLSPSDVAVLESGAIVVADTGNNAIRQIYQGEVTTIAGGKGAGLVNGYRQVAKFDGPSALAVLADGSILVSDTENNAIRKIEKDGRVTTLNVKVLKPAGIDVSGKDVFVCELETSSIVNFKENDKAAAKVLGGERGFVNGFAGIARFAAPSDIFVYDSAFYIADTGNHAVRKAYIASNGQRAVDILLGGRVGFVDGEVLLLDSPKSILVAAGRLFVADTNNSRVLKFCSPKELMPVRNYEKCLVPDSADIYVDGVKVRFDDVRPIIVNGRTYVPLRVLVEFIGGDVEWIASERAVVCRYENLQIKLKDGLIINDGRSFVPLRQVVETFGMEINWIGDLRVIEINTIK